MADNTSHKPLIMSHGSMSYLPPRRWWQLPFRFIARTQSLSIYDQYAKGIRYFDIRLRLHKGQWVFAHGSMIFKSNISPEQLFHILDGGNNVHVRLVLEYNNPTNNIDYISNQFTYHCDIWRKSFPSITFFEFTRKYDWRKLYTYADEPIPTMYQAISSMAGRRILCWWPWLYAWINNKDTIAQGSNKDILSIDFV